MSSGSSQSGSSWKGKSGGSRKAKQSRRAEKKGPDGGDELLGTPLNIAALPNANQVTLHSEEDHHADGQTEAKVLKSVSAKKQGSPVVNKKKKKTMTTHSKDKSPTKKSKKEKESKKEKKQMKEKRDEKTTNRRSDEEAQEDEKEAEVKENVDQRTAVSDSDVEDERGDQEKHIKRASGEVKSSQGAEPNKGMETTHQGDADSSQDPLLSGIDQRFKDSRKEAEERQTQAKQEKEKEESVAEEEKKAEVEQKAASQASSTRDKSPTYIDLSQHSDEDNMPLTQYSRSDKPDPMALVTKRKIGNRKATGLSTTKRRAERLAVREDSAAELDTDLRTKETSTTISTAPQPGAAPDYDQKRDKSEDMGREKTSTGNQAEERGWYRKVDRVEEDEGETEEQPTLSQKERKRKEKGKDKQDDEAEEEETMDFMSSGIPVLSEPDTPSLQATQVICPMCNKSVKHMDAEAREAHVNSCIDSRQQQSGADDDADFVETFNCELCGKNLTKWNPQRRQQHMERCLDALRQLSQSQNGENKQEDQSFGEITEARYRCPVCKTDRSSSSLVARIDHLKKCARKHNLSIDAFRNAKKWNEMVNKIETTSGSSTSTATKKPKRTTREPKKKATTTTTRRAKRSRKVKESSEESSEQNAAAEVKSKFFSEGVDAVSHANFLATIAKLRYKSKGTSKDSADAEPQKSMPQHDPEPVSVAPQATESASTSIRPVPASTAASGSSSLPSIAASSTTTPSGAEPSELEEDFAETQHFKKPPVPAPKKRTAREKKLSYDDLVDGMNEEDEELMLAVALSDSLAPAPVAAHIDSIESSPESPNGPRDLAGFRLQEPKPIVATEVVKDLFPDASQDIQPTPKLAESSLAKKKSPQPERRASLWNLSSSGAGAYDPEFIRTTVLPPSDKKQLADKAKLHPQVTPGMLESGNGRTKGTKMPAAECSDRAGSDKPDPQLGVDPSKEKNAEAPLDDTTDDITQLLPNHNINEKQYNEKEEEASKQGEEVNVTVEDDEDGGFIVSLEFPGDNRSSTEAPQADSTHLELERESEEVAPLAPEGGAKPMALTLPTQREDRAATKKLRHRIRTSEDEEESDKKEPQPSQHDDEEIVPSQKTVRKEDDERALELPTKRQKKTIKSNFRRKEPEDSDEAVSNEEENEEEEEDEEQKDDFASRKDRKQLFFAEAQTIMQQYKMACAEAERLMEERIKEIKAAYLAEIGRITIEKENRMQRLQRKYQVTSSLLLSSPFASDTPRKTKKNEKSSPSFLLSSGNLPLKQEKKRKSPSKSSLAGRSKRAKREKSQDEEDEEEIIEIGPSQLIFSRTDPYAENSDEDFKPARRKASSATKLGAMDMTARKRRRKDVKSEGDEEKEVESRRIGLKRHASNNQFDRPRHFDESPYPASKSPSNENRRKMSPEKADSRTNSGPLRKKPIRSSDEDEEDEDSLNTPSPIQKKSMNCRREDSSDDDEKRREGRRGESHRRLGKSTETTVKSRQSSPKKSDASATANTTKERQQSTSTKKNELRPDDVLEPNLADLDQPLPSSGTEVNTQPLQSPEADQLSGKPMCEVDEAAGEHFGGLDSYGFEDDVPTYTFDSEIVRIEIDSSPPENEEEVDDIQDKQYPGDPLSFIITKKSKPPDDADVPLSQSDHLAGTDAVDSTPPEDLGPALPSSTSTAISARTAFQDTARLPRITTLLQASQDEEDRLSPWSARILANKRKKQEQQRRRSRIDRAAVEDGPEESDDEDSDDDDQDEVFASPTPPPPPLPPLTPLASASTDQSVTKSTTEPLLISSQGDVNASPLLFTPVQCANSTTGSASDKSTSHLAVPSTSRGPTRLVPDLDYRDDVSVEDDDLDSILHSEKNLDLTTRKEKGRAKAVPQDSEQEVTTSQEAEAERRRFRAHDSTSSKPTRSKPKPATKSKGHERKGKRKSSSEDDKSEHDDFLSTPTLGGLLAPGSPLTPRELLRSPIRSLTEPSQADAIERRRVDDVKRTTREPKRRRREALIEQDDNGDDAEKENNENGSKRRAEDSHSGKCTEHHHDGGEDDAHAEDDAATPSCTPRTTLSLHSKRCHNTPKPVYSDMSDSLLKTLLSGFGVRSGSRKWMVEKLSEIWDASHEPAKALPLDHPSIVEGVKMFAHEKEDDPKKKEKEKELATKVTAWVKSNKRIYLKILQYKEIDLLELQSALKEEGIKCSRDFLVAYLNTQGVVFRGPPKKKRNGWHM